MATSRSSSHSARRFMSVMISASRSLVDSTAARITICSSMLALSRHSSRQAKAAVLTLLLATLPGLLAAQPDEPPTGPASGEIPFDIFIRGDSLTGWIDLSGLLGSATIARLEDGIDLAFDCRARLNRPRRLFGSVRIAERTELWRLSYRVLTEHYVVATLSADSAEERSFGSLAGLAGFLADSLQFPLIPVDSLERGQGYVLEFSVAAISLAGLGILLPNADTADGESPLKALFREFLELTGYAREERSFSSRPFSVDELESR
ncbi:DUF4390 domain-containing protein [candidate division GN15 bacterium]|nr:DUF4390 domain-containing protein [candidate division GN15 bacterium]